MAGGSGIAFELKGQQGLEAALERTSDAVRVLVSRALRETAFAIMNRARANVPKRTGDLAANIGVQGKGMRWRVGIYDTSYPSRGGGDGRKNAYAHQNPWVYGQWVEGALVIEHGNEGFRAHPFMRPAAEAEAGPFEARIEQAGVAIGKAAIAPENKGGL